jgi:phosphohistidine phosphatase
LFAEMLGPGIAVNSVKGMDPGDDVITFSDRLDTDMNLMLVGHLPFMERLTSYLLTGSADKTVFKFQNGGILCLSVLPETGSWAILWSLMPHIG